MTPTRDIFGRDRGLELRMVLTLLLLGLLYCVLGAALLAAGAGAAVLGLVMAGLALAQLCFSDRLALRAVGARAVSPAEAPRLHAIVERLCVIADLPKPRLAVAEVDLPNAFVVGRSRSSATMCVTSGLLDRLDGHELEAVIAHELAHVEHRDVLVMTAASFFASVAALIAQFGLFFGGGSRDREQLPFAVVVAISFAVYLVSYLLTLALSRYREFAADRGGAAITGRPAALASALMRISDAVGCVPQKDLRAAGTLNAFFIIPTRSSLQAALSSHPPVEQRVQRLLALEARMHGAPSPRPEYELAGAATGSSTGRTR